MNCYFATDTYYFAFKRNSVEQGNKLDFVSYSSEMY